MAGTVQTTTQPYDPSGVGTPWQELVKAIPTLTQGFGTVYTTVAQPQPVLIAQPAPAPAPSGPQLNGTTVAYAGLGLAGIVAAILLVKALK